METKTFHIKATKQRTNNYSICSMDDLWFSGFGQIPVKKGDRVEVEYTTDGRWKNIQNIKVLTPSENEFKTANELNEKPNEKAVTMLVSYVKDLVCAQIEAKAGKQELSINALDVLFDGANAEVWKSYDFFKKKLNGEEPKEA